MPIEIEFTMAHENPAEFIDLGKLPSGPRVLSRLISMVRQPGVQLADVADLFRSDPALTARVVAACHSPYYSRGERTAKYNQLLRIEEQLGDVAVYPGWKAFRQGGKK